MNTQQWFWRPTPTVRPLSVGIVCRHEKLLVMAVRDDEGAIKGLRPLGGAIEFGERAAAALERKIWILGAAGAGAERVARLRHEARSRDGR